MKAVEICQQQPVPEGLLGLLKFLFVESSNGKILLQEVSDFDSTTNR